MYFTVLLQVKLKLLAFSKNYTEFEENQLKSSDYLG
jgi:hypothetical protein